MINNIKIFFGIIFALISIQGCYKAPVEQPYRVTELNNLILNANKAFERGNITTAQTLYQEALNKSRLIQDDNATVIVLISLSRLYTSIGKIDEAKKFIDSAIAVSKRTNLPENTLEELDFEICRIAFLLNQNPEERLNNLIQSKNRLIKIKALNLLARIKIKNNEYNVVEQLLKQSLNINQQISKLEEANSLRLLGNIYKKQNPELAEKYLLRALELDKELALPEKIAIDLEELGYLYKNTGQIDKAKEFFYKALEIWKGLGRKNLEMNIIIELENL